jgi:hypothetical protein
MTPYLKTGVYKVEIPSNVQYVLLSKRQKKKGSYWFAVTVTG